MTQQSAWELELLGGDLNVAKMPGHWLLARWANASFTPAASG